MCSGVGDTTQLVPGSPIRTPCDHSSVGSSPRPIAASHVLHRLLVPRHSPCALSNLTTKMLASTVQFSTNTQPTTPTHGPHPPPQPHQRGHDHECCPVTGDVRHVDLSERPTPTRGCSLRTQQGAHTTHQPHPPTPFPPQGKKPHGCTRRTDRCRPWLASVSAIEHPTETSVRRGLLDRFHGQVLLRKEVIQPHLPVRLPCYDFVPIASPTFDGSLPQGVRPPASGVADFRDVKGGVNKARERIHRSVADLRLLATPTSRGRVADPDPN